MSGDGDVQLDAFAVDVRDLLERNVANLYSHLVTRPTGRAVRMAIQAQLRELGSPVLSLVDLSSVSILDYSCADEVVAKLLLDRQGGHPGGDVTTDVFYVFQGLREHHLEPILEVLIRHRLTAVARVGQVDAFGLMGAHSPLEEEVWGWIEERGRVQVAELEDLLPEARHRNIAGALADQGLVFRHPTKGDLHALSTLVRSP